MEIQIENIPSDEVTEMTDIFYRAFKTHDCAPCCHYCLNDLEVGSKFKLATVIKTGSSESDNAINSVFTHSAEVMLCDKCTAEQYSKRTLKDQKAYEKRRESGGGCMRINGKITH